MVALLIRHGHAAPVGRSLAGRMRGIGLSHGGREEVARLVQALAWMPIAAVYTSPLERAVDTALPIAAAHGLDARARPDLIDVDFGDWTGKTLDQLSGDPEWEEFNRDRDHGCPPHGEPLADVQRRMLRELTALSKPHAGEIIALVTHAEPIRCAIAGLTGQSLNDVVTLDIEPGHLCAVGLTSNLRSVLGVNLRPDEIAV